MSLLSSKTSLKSLKYSDFIQSQKLESPTDLKAFSNTDASVGQHRSPDTKSGLGLQVEKRKEDVIRLGKATVNSPQAIRFQTNQALLNQSGTINKLLRGDRPDGREVAIGAARVAGVTASAIAQAAGSGTGLRVLQGFVPLNGGYVREEGSLLGAAVASLNPFGTENQISKAYIALRGTVINDGFIGTEFEEAVGFDTKALEKEILINPSVKFKSIKLNRLSVPRPESRLNGDATYLSKEFAEIKPGFNQKITITDSGKTSRRFADLIPIADRRVLDEKREPEDFTTGRFSDSESYIGKTTNPTQSEEKLKQGNFVKQTTPVKSIKETKRSTFNKDKGTNSLESRFFTSKENKAGTAGQDKLNVLSFRTEEINNIDSDIIPFTIQNIRATGKPEYLYFRAYLDSLSDSYSGEWSGTRYIGRAEELYNYTGFKRGLQFSFKIAAHSPQELKPLYEKLNRLVGTTAPTYQNGLFMQGVFSKITIGDYVQKLPGFFTSVDLTWQTTYPWEIGNVDDVDDGAAVGPNTPRVPHILDVSVSFQPVHDFAPQYDKTFIGFSSNTPIAVNG